MIKKIKSRLSIKVFLMTLLLAMTCCFVTYRFLSWSVPNFYKYNLEDVETEYSFLPDVLSQECKENGYFIVEAVDEEIRQRYETEFELHLFQPDGQEVSLHDIDSDSQSLQKPQDADGQEMKKSKAYTVTFTDSDSPYTLLLTRNPMKRTQMEEALRRTFPPLFAVILSSSVLSAFFYSWYMTAPIKKVSRLSKRMADMDFSGFCPGGRTDEIGVLSDSLNTLSKKLTAALSKLQEANLKLQADMDRERGLERQRAEFFSAASHELKTPITIIKGQLQGMLYQVGRYKDRETYLAKSLEVTDTLENMVGELLTISRFDTPGFACRKCSLNPAKLINSRLAAYEDLFMQKNLTVEHFLSPEIFILGDRQLLQKVIDNLLGNAAAYSQAGNHIILNLWKEAEKVSFTIENTGAHISDKDIPRLFEAFYRADPSRNRQTGGTGLGLYIVKTILDLHGADIAIANTNRGVMVSIQF